MMKLEKYSHIFTIWEQLKGIETQINNLKQYTTLGEDIDWALDEVHSPQDIDSLDDMFELFEKLYTIYRADNCGESLTPKYKHIIEELLK